MRLGILKIDPQIKKGELVKIVDEKNSRALAVGKLCLIRKKWKQKLPGK